MAQILVEDDHVSLYLSALARPHPSGRARPAAPAPPSPSSGVKQFTARPLARATALVRPTTLTAVNNAVTGRISSDRWRMVPKSCRGEAAAAAALATSAPPAAPAAPAAPEPAEPAPAAPAPAVPPAAPPSAAPAAPEPAAPAAPGSEAEPKTKGAAAEGARAKRQLQQLDENVPVPSSSKQPKPAERAAPAESTSRYAAGGLPLDAKAVGKSVRAALRGHPELQTSTLKQLRLHLETKLGDLTEWKVRGRVRGRGRLTLVS